MRSPSNSPSNLVVSNLFKLQERLAGKVVLKDAARVKKPRLVAGVDEAFYENHDQENGEKIVSAAVACSLPSLERIAASHATQRATFPYIPGLLAFREGPAIAAALKALAKKLRCFPDVTFVNGAGIAHPRRCGLASHVGLQLGIPTIGVTQSLLCGEIKGIEKGVGMKGTGSTRGLAARKPCRLMFEGRHVGWAYRPSKAFAPIFVSPGHLVSLRTSLELVQVCLSQRRLPEPLWLAHERANELKRLVEAQRPR